MTQKIGSADSEQDIRREAAHWLSRLNDDDVRDHDRTEFLAWFSASPAHHAAFHEVERAWNRMRAAADDPRILSLRSKALARVATDRRAARSWATASAAALIIAVGGAGLYLGGTQSPLLRGFTPQRYANPSDLGEIVETRIGERTSVTLADGSLVMLNTATRVRVAFASNERAIFLESGEAYFTVAHGDARPFNVYARGTLVRAHGTQFDVRLSGASVQVALVEGSVSVGSVKKDVASTVRLQPNQLLTVTAGEQTVRGFKNADEVLGWQEGFLFFDDVTIREAAVEMNRYVDRPRIEVSEAVAQVRLSGAFRTGGTGEFVEALERSFPVKVVSRTSDTIVLGAAP